MAKIKKLTMPIVDKDMEQLDLSHEASETAKIKHKFWKPVCQFFINLNLYLPYNHTVQQFPS